MQVKRPGEMLEFEVWDGRLIRQFQVSSSLHLLCMCSDEATFKSRTRYVSCNIFAHSSCPLQRGPGKLYQQGGAAAFVMLAHVMQGRCQLLLADVLDNRHVLGEWPLKDVKHGR